MTLGLDLLDVAIGVIFVLFLISTLCAAIREGLEGWFKSRAALLEFGIRELLHDRKGCGLAKSLFTHPLIFNLFSGEYVPGRTDRRPLPWNRGRDLPSYIPARNFALALMDLAARGSQTDAVSSDPSGPSISLGSVRASILNLRNPFVQRAVLAAIDSAQGDFDRAVANLEAWYDSSMDRVSGWYKRSTQWLIFGIALAVAIGLNVNTFTIADYLYRNDAVRAAIVSRAERAVAESAPQTATYTDAKRDLESLRLPIGWERGWGAPMSRAERRSTSRPGFEAWNDVFAPLFGWLITALAATLGAPFWFDVLNRVMVIRSTVKPHEKSPEESSEDRQAATARASDAGPPREPAVGVAVSRTTALSAIASPAPRDAESNIDGCDVEMVNPTADEDLPAARGGVA